MNKIVEVVGGAVVFILETVEIICLLIVVIVTVLATPALIFAFLWTVFEPLTTIKLIGCIVVAVIGGLLFLPFLFNNSPAKDTERKMRERQKKEAFLKMFSL